MIKKIIKERYHRNYKIVIDVLQQSRMLLAHVSSPEKQSLCYQGRSKSRWVLCQLTCAGCRTLFSTRREKIQKPFGANSSRSSKICGQVIVLNKFFIVTPGHENVWQGITIWILKWMGWVICVYSRIGSLFVRWVGTSLSLRADRKRWKLKRIINRNDVWLSKQLLLSF
jgi:hypothetical protein